MSYRQRTNTSTYDRHRSATPDEVLARARTGDRRAWDELVDAHAGDIRAFAARRGVDDVDDLVQDVFLAAAARLETFDGSAKQFRSWLFTVAHRRVADAHRARYRSKTVLTDEIDIAAPGGSVEDQIAETETVSEALTALSVLDQRERQVLLMRVIDEKSSAEVAAELGLSAVNARVIQSRALTKLRRELERTSRNTASLAAIALGTMTLSDRLSALTGRLPRDAQLASWISDARSEVAAHLGPGATAADVSALVELANSGSPTAGVPGTATYAGASGAPAESATAVEPAPTDATLPTGSVWSGTIQSGSALSGAVSSGIAAGGGSAGAGVGPTAVAGSAMATGVSLATVAATAGVVVLGIGAVLVAEATIPDGPSVPVSTPSVTVDLPVPAPTTSIVLDLDRTTISAPFVPTTPALGGAVTTLVEGSDDLPLLSPIGPLPTDSAPDSSTLDGFPDSEVLPSIPTTDVEDVLITTTSTVASLPDL